MMIGVRTGSLWRVKVSEVEAPQVYYKTPSFE